MIDAEYNVLFLCTGNSARSILAECILNREGAGRFAAYSAGSHPQGAVHPLALALLKHNGFETQQLRSKSWDEFAEPDSPAFNFVITVCGNAANETCPVWTGHSMRAHWGIPDPAAAQGSESERALAFADAYRMLSLRIAALVNLPIESLGKISLHKHLSDIGETTS